MKGTSDAVFSPDAALTRAQLVTILWRVAGEPAADEAAPYSDVRSGDWYAKAAYWAAEAGLTDRESGSFGPDDALRRDEAVYLLWNTAKYLGADVSVGEDTNILSYDDAFDIAEGRASAMQWAVGADVLRGTGAATLSPGGLLTRAQTAVLLRRFAAALRAPSPLSLWTEGSTPSETLIAYIEAITDEDSAD